MSNLKEIWIVPFFGQGHLLPSIELCKQIASRNFKSTLIISSNLSSSVPSSFLQYPLVQIAEIPSEISSSQPPPPPPPPTLSLPQTGSNPPHPPHPPHPHQKHHGQMEIGIENLLAGTEIRPVCVILDVMMSWSSDIFKKFEVPTIGFFTSGACSAAMEYAMWKFHPLDLKPGETRLIPELPEEMAVTYSDTKRKSHGPPPPGPPGPAHESSFPPPHGLPHNGLGFGPLSGPVFPAHEENTAPPKFRGHRMGPPKPDDPPPWVNEVEGTIGLMINTCEELERPFITYIANQKEKPVWGVGPLLPEKFWKSIGSVIHDHEIRTNRKSNVDEDEVVQWLESKPHGSVLYVSFGTEVGPTIEEYEELAQALEASKQPFIWVIQPGSGRPGPPHHPGSGEPKEGYYPHGLEERVGNRGLIISGWAPQLLILSHPSTGGFLSHCGWNSTMEAIGVGVPLLAWPIRGDQHYDAKLVVSYLKIGYMISVDMSKKIEKDEIIEGIEKLMGDADMKKRALLLRAKFEHGFPKSSVAALDAFGDFVNHNLA